MQEIDISSKIKEFREHLECNPKVILSAHFGDGKTTFLRKFTEQYKDEIYPITIYPVNYSVAKNEDIFEYIKYDILTQLTQSNLVEDIDVESIWKAIKNNYLTVQNVLSVCSLLCAFLPGISPGSKVLDTLT